MTIIMSYHFWMISTFSWGLWNWPILFAFWKTNICTVRTPEMIDKALWLLIPAELDIHRMVVQQILTQDLEKRKHCAIFVVYQRNKNKRGWKLVVKSPTAFSKLKASVQRTKFLDHDNIKENITSEIRGIPKYYCACCFKQMYYVRRNLVLPNTLNTYVMAFIFQKLFQHSWKWIATPFMYYYYFSL